MIDSAVHIEQTINSFWQNANCCGRKFHSFASTIAKNLGPKKIQTKIVNSVFAKMSCIDKIIRLLKLGLFLTPND